MKRLIYILLLLSPLYIKAQDKSEKVKPPQIITKLKPGKTINFKDSSVKFLKVLEDSRCPTDVNCVWAGQAKVLIGIYENNTLLEEKEIIIGAKGIRPTSPKEILKSGDKFVYGYNLSPYPSGSKKTDPTDYYLELLVK
ncbi:hypothetical protein [Aquimarina rubra]|uniref:DUF4920 domain-containing protein n=1 Tax=Aquimarina rubra TaxID=1920033 RepID=A0ABW5LGT1_9FLAO